MTPAVGPPIRPAEAAHAREYPAFPILAVSLAVFRAGEVLLATRTRAPFAGAFSLPGGVVEAGETLRDAALRELREEVAVEARIVAFNRHVESIEPDKGGRIRRHFVIASFVGEWISGEGTPGAEAGEIIWIEPSALAPLDCTPHTADVVASAALLFAARRSGAAIER
jgi:ADP-ribose pyrophosphatase YjhB (NUDIX family)